MSLPSLHSSLNGFVGGGPPGSRLYLKSRGVKVRSFSMYTPREAALAETFGEAFELTQRFELRTCVIHRLAGISEMGAVATDQVCFFCHSTIRAYKNRDIAIDNACLLAMDDFFVLREQKGYHCPYYYDALCMNEDVFWANGEQKSYKGQILPICTCCRSLALIDSTFYTISKDDPLVRLFVFNRTYLDNTIQRFHEYHMKHSSDDDDGTDLTEPENDPNPEVEEDTQVVQYGSPKDQDEDTPDFLRAAGWSSSEIQLLITSMTQ